MILECSQCGSRYDVPSSAIGPDGRTVRCVNCKHSWFQAPEAPASFQPAPDAAPAPPTVAEESAPPPPPIVDPVEAAPETPDYDPFIDPPPAPRRNRLPWTIAAIVATLSVLLGAAALLHWKAPGLAAQIGLNFGATETPLLFSEKNVELKTRVDGSRLFIVSGKVLNPTRTAQHVPDIRIRLMDGASREVYGWRITPATRTLDPQASMEFNGAKVDVPAEAKVARLSFASEIGE